MSLGDCTQTTPVVTYDYSNKNHSATSMHSYQNIERKLVDCHCHVLPPEFDIEEIFEFCKTRILIAVAFNLEQIDELIDLSKRIPSFHACIGVHPGSIDFEQVRSLKDLKQQIFSPLSEKLELYHEQIVGIGEIGLDFRPSVLTPENKEKEWRKKAQMELFKFQINLASQYQLPINVHSRHAGHHAIEEIIASRKHFDQYKVLMHAFDGQMKYVEDAINNTDFIYFSVPTNVERLNNTSAMRQWIDEWVPLSRLVLESDSPALSPDETVSRNTPKSLEVAFNFLLSKRSKQLAKMIEESQKTGVTREEYLRDMLSINTLNLFPSLIKIFQKVSDQEENDS